MITRRTFTAAALTAVGSTLAACGSKNSASSATSAKAGDSFTYWSMWKEGEDQQKVLAAQLDAFTKESGVKVEVQWAGREVLTQLVPRLNAGNPPDLVDNGSTDLIAKVGTSNLMELDDVYGTEIPGESGKKVSDVIPESLMTTMKTEGGKPFLVPYEIIGATVWYNAKLDPQLASTTPKSWAEFIKVLDALKARGRTPLALDGDIADYCGYWVEWAVLRAGGPGVITDAAKDTSGAKFSEPAWVAGTDAVAQLVKGKYFPVGFRGTKFPTQQAAWADQTSKTNIIVMGSWLPSEATASLAKSGGDPSSIQFRSFPFPSVGENKGAGLVEAQPIGFAIPAKARHAAGAKQFMAWFMNKDRIGQIATAAKNLTPRIDVEAPAELKDFFEEYKAAKTTVPFTDGVGTVEPKWVTDVWQPALGELFDGTLDGAGFRKELTDKTVAYHKSK